jgi:DNA-binding NtrC family response regulator
MPAPVLVVHDEVDICELAVSSLVEAGFEAIGFHDPMVALDAIEAESRVRVLVTRVDFGTGRLNGIALARMLKLKRPAVKVVFVARAEYSTDASGLGDFLPMPLDARLLVDTVGQLMAP